MVQSRLLHTIRPGLLFDTVWAGADVGRVLNYECCLPDVDLSWGIQRKQVGNGVPSYTSWAIISYSTSAIAQLYMVAAGEIYVSSLNNVLQTTL